MRKLYFRMIRADVAKSRLATLTTLLFVTVAAMLVALAAILVVNLVGAIDTMMALGKTPHFMQMHTGVIHSERIAAFAEEQDNVQDYQILEFLNIDNTQIVIGGESLVGSLQDNGFVVQSGRFDYLLDLNGEIIHADDGEVYVPITYMREGTAEIGDPVTVCGTHFTVAGFLRDSQMNASLSTSKRFLVSDNDYKALREHGNLEYLIEFRLNDLNMLSTFEADYIAAGLETGGPTLTYPLFRLVNALSDGLMIAVILLVSLLVVAIALLCIRFTLLAKIEDEYREIGVMKAIGLRVSDIRGMYMAKYAALAASGCMAGFLLALVLRGPLSESIRLNMGEGGSSAFAFLLGILGILLVFLAIMAYVSGVLRHFKKISPANALRFGMAEEKPKGAKHFRLSQNRGLNTNIFLGFKDVLARGRLYSVMLVVLILAVFIMVVPLNLSSTISSREFIRYMGIGDYDLRIDIQQTDDIEVKAMQIMNTLEADADIADANMLITKSFVTRLDNGTSGNIKVELGDHTVFSIPYAQGRTPFSNNEIALSHLLAEDLEKAPGDVIVLVIGGEEKSFTICGIYSDVTNGGKTAKATFTDNSGDVLWYLLGATLVNPAQAEAVSSKYTDNFPYAKVSDVSEYVSQTLDSTTTSLNTASYTAVAVALAISFLVTLLFTKMLVAKDRYVIAVMKALGFTNRDVRTQYIARSALVFVVGISLGVLLSATLGEVLARMLISGMGVTFFSFTINPIAVYGLCPLAILCAIITATLLGTAAAGRVNISEAVKE